MAHIVLKTSEKTDKTLEKVKRLAMRNEIELIRKDEQIEFSIALLQKALERMDEDTLLNVMDLKR